MPFCAFCDGRFNRLYSERTGLVRKNIDDVRDRRANVAKHHLTQEGIFGTKRKLVVVQCFDVIKEIQGQGKFQLDNNERFKELAIMKLKEPEEAWSPFEFDEWFEDIKHAVAPLAPDESLCDWILQQAHTVQRTFVKKKERIKEDEPRLQGTENEKEKITR